MTGSAAPSRLLDLLMGLLALGCVVLVGAIVTLLLRSPEPEPVPIVEQQPPPPPPAPAPAPALASAPPAPELAPTPRPALEPKTRTSTPSSFFGRIRNAATYTLHRDDDRDGFGDSSVTIESPRQRMAGYVPSDLPADCNDSNPFINPKAVERCNDLDDDCNGRVDDILTGGESCRQDLDGDGFGSDLSAQPLCRCVGDLVPAENPVDCNDADTRTFPGAEEIKDNRDNDCDGRVDEDLIELTQRVERRKTEPLDQQSEELAATLDGINPDIPAPEELGPLYQRIASENLNPVYCKGIDAYTAYLTQHGPARELLLARCQKCMETFQQECADSSPGPCYPRYLRHCAAALPGSGSTREKP